MKILKKSSVLRFGGLALAPLLGFSALFLPAWTMGGLTLPAGNNAMARLIEEVPKHMLFLPSIALLVLSGLVVGSMTGSFWFLSGVLTILVFPVGALYDLMILDPRSHNLWPFEFAIYLIMATPGIIGAWIGHRVAGRLLDC
jgi:hypothetical protein